MTKRADSTDTTAPRRRASLLGVLTRRSLLAGASAAMAVAGTALSLARAAAPTVQSDGDAGLLALCAEFHRIDTWRETASGEEFEAHLDEYTEAWWEKVREIADVTATAKEGLRQQSRVAFLALQDELNVARDGWRERANDPARLTLGILQQIAGEA